MFILDIWGTSSGNVFAVGRYFTMERGFVTSTPSIILHYDGSAWTPMVNRPSGPIFGIWGSSASDVIAVGDPSLHYDGLEWTTLPGVVGSEAWGASSTDVFTAGFTSGVVSGVTISHFDGSGWFPMVPGTSVNVEEIWGFSATEVFVVGNGGTILRRRCTPSTPDPVVFLGRTGAALSRAVTAATVRVSGICTTTPISVSGGEYSINGGGYTNLPGTVGNGHAVDVRMVSSSTPATTATAMLTVGAASGTFSVTTQVPQGETRKKNDFDGDGRTEIGCYDPTGGNWYQYRSQEGYSQTPFGYEGTIPIVGDFDGDGRDDFGCYDKASQLFGQISVFRSSEGFWQTTWTPQAEPVVGDFDGDGKDDIGLFTDRVGQWDLIKSSEGLGRVFFGFPGVIPLGNVIR